MNQKERRRYPRVAAYYPISYECIDANGRILEQKMGIALNISQRGILIETPGVVESEYIRLITIGLNNDLMEIKGKITYCTEIGAGKYRTGIQFQGSPAQSIEFAKALIRSYHVKKQKYRYKGYKGYE